MPKKREPSEKELEEEFSIPNAGLGHTEYLASAGWFLAKYNLGKCATCVCQIYKGEWARSVDAGVICEPCGVEVE